MDLTLDKLLTPEAAKSVYEYITNSDSFKFSVSMSAHKSNKMYIVTGTCWKCNESINAAMIRDEQLSTNKFYGPADFSKNQIQFAREKGVIIEEHFSFTRQETYLANTCGKCKTFIGEHYLFTEYFVTAMNGDCDFKTYDVF